MHVHRPDYYMGVSQHFCIRSDCLHRRNFNMVAGIIQIRLLVGQLLSLSVVPFLQFLNNQMKQYICSVCLRLSLVVAILCEILSEVHEKQYSNRKFNTKLFHFITWNLSSIHFSDIVSLPVLKVKKMVISQNHKTIKSLCQKNNKISNCLIFLFYIKNKRGNYLFLL